MLSRISIGMAFLPSVVEFHRCRIGFKSSQYFRQIRVQVLAKPFPVNRFGDNVLRTAALAEDELASVPGLSRAAWRGELSETYRSLETWR